MSIILFANRKKFNVISRRAAVAAVRIAICGIVLVIGCRAQGDWASPLKECWKYLNAHPSTNTLASDNEYIFLPTSKGSIIALNQHNGLIVWNTDLGGNLDTRIVVEGARMYASAYFGNGSNEDGLSVVREIDSRSGLPYWQVSEKHSGRKQMFVGPETLFISYSDDGVVERYASGGIPVWKLDLGTGITSGISFFGRNLVLGTANKTILFISAESGELISQVNVKGIPTVVTAYSQIFLTGDSAGNVYAFETERPASIWRARTGGGITGITIFGSDAIVISKDNFVYSIAVGSGKKNWKRKLAGRIYGMAQIDPEHAVFTSSGSTTAVILNLMDGRLVNKIDLADDFVSQPVKINGGFALPTETSVTAITSSACKN